MSDNVFVNRDFSKVVPAGSSEAKWQISRREAVKLGLLSSEEKPTQERRSFDPAKATYPKQQRRSAKRK